MKYFVLFSVFFCAFLVTKAQEGVRFQDLSFEEAKALAVKENKLLFIDMSMSGCMPCVYMLENVFVLPEVGKFYNERFVCVHYNASTQEEGAKVMEMFGVKAFPTFLFIDPKDGTLFHRSLGGRSAEEIIEVGQRALDPAKASESLEKQYIDGNREFDFLVTYYDLKSFERETAKMKLVLSEMTERWGAKFKDPKMNDFFFKHVTIKQNPLTDYFLKNTSKMIKKFGKEKVFDKIGKLR